MANWWFDEQGRNNLAGIPGDTDNPAVLPDHVILDFLLNIPAAKEAFKATVPLMSVDEQARLNGIVARNPLALAPFSFNDQQQSDVFMSLQNTPGVRDPNRRGSPR
jgi:hypothetical protein